MLAVPTGALSARRTNDWGILSAMAVACLARSKASSKGSLPRDHSFHLQRTVTSTRSGLAMVETTEIDITLQPSLARL
jgi:hypothetical protein